MEGGSPSSVVQCKSIVKSIAIIDEMLICGLDNGSIEIFQWESGIHQCLFNIYSINTKEEHKSTQGDVIDYQVIHLCVIDDMQRILIAQCRNGDLFSIELFHNEPKILSLIRTGIESFVKIGYYDYQKDKEITRKKLIASSDKENELLIVDLGENFKTALTSSIILSNPLKNQKDDNNQHSDDDDDSDTIISNKSLINCILTKKENAFILFSFESCLIQLTTLDFELITYIHLHEGNTSEPIITMNSFKINSITFISIGLFSTKGIILKYSKKQLSIAHVINDLSSQLRYGISSIYYSKIIKQDLLSIESEETKETYLLCFGGYDHRVKFYDISTQTQLSSIPQIKPMGHLILPNQKIINQILISSNKDQSYYLFVASDQKLLYIYLIA